MGAPSDESGVDPHHILYGILEQDLRASYDHGDRYGGVYLHGVYLGDSERGKIQKIQQPRIFGIKGDKPGGGICVDVDP